MPHKSALAAVPDPEPTAESESAAVPSGLVKAAAASSRRDLLVSLRDNIAGQIDAGVPPRDLASLSRRLLEIAREIEAIDAGEKGDDVGDAAATPDEPWSAE